MSIEQQYDAWVQGLVGGKRSAAGESEDARSSLEQMQAQLDALAAGQKRQTAAAKALDAVQKAAGATAESVRRMSSELTSSLRSDGLLDSAQAQPACRGRPRRTARVPGSTGLAARVRAPGHRAG